MKNNGVKKNNEVKKDETKKDNWIKRLWRFYHPLEEKIVYGPGVIGCYDSRPFDNFYYSLVYAGETKLVDENDVKIFTRVYKETTFVNVLVYDDTNFDITKYDYTAMRELLLDNGISPTDKSVVLVLFQHRNDNTISMCKKFCKSDKFNFEQACVYNPVDVRMDFYKPVPKFYKLYNHFLEDLYFDLAFIDNSR